ncbi:MAG TPA: FABP family protein [Propionibacteriaceae bacterium]|nr:FABP family protein [Propionibacteriaceae bacterium]
MAFEIPSDLNPALMGVAWMIGHWEGNGHGTWPGQGDFTYGQRVDFTTNGGEYLHYISQWYTIGEDGVPERALGMETGFWRPQLDGTVEVVLSNPEGWSEVWHGAITGARIQLVTDAVMRTESASVSYTGGQRLYGNVEGDLLWTLDRATTDVPLQPFMWARLQRS